MRLMRSMLSSPTQVESIVRAGDLSSGVNHRSNGRNIFEIDDDVILMFDTSDWCVIKKSHKNKFFLDGNLYC